jgi:hypothetical protein
MLKSQTELDELADYIQWYGGMKTSCDAWNWLNLNIPNWMQKHDTKITYEDQIGSE